MTELRFEFSDYVGQKDLESVLDSIDFSGWHFHDDKTIDDLIRNCVSESWRNSLPSNMPEIVFGTTSILVSIDYGSSMNDGVFYFNADIEEMIDELIVFSHRSQMAGGDELKTDLAQCLSRCATKLQTAAGAIP